MCGVVLLTHTQEGLRLGGEGGDEVSHFGTFGFHVGRDVVTNQRLGGDGADGGYEGGGLELREELLEAVEAAREGEDVVDLLGAGEEGDVGFSAGDAVEGLL